ncbi:MAG: YiiX/YebB-like N1pC/P60 family cysteine hydrolase, partial [bacterium]|nr:YiiX/YebB-like N1pC/P60 family cysteine hydrolase [bacterium]
LYYPVLTTVSNFLGDTKVVRKDMYLITDEQITEIVAHLEPGDIFFERRNWYLSNIFIPGFWPHAGIYVGTYHQACEYFDRTEIRSYFSLLGFEGFRDYVEQMFPEAAASWKEPNHHDSKPNRIIESIRDGVVFSSAFEAFAADFLGVLRPRLPYLERAKAVIHALTFWGSEYDYDFNFRADDMVFCTEFVAKAYAGDSEKLGLKFPLEDIPFGKKVVQANGMARTYAEETGTPTFQLSFIYFIKGLEDELVAVPGTEQEFRQSYTWKGLLEAGPALRTRRLRR